MVFGLILQAIVVLADPRLTISPSGKTANERQDADSHDCCTPRHDMLALPHSCGKGATAVAVPLAKRRRTTELAFPPDLCRRGGRQRRAGAPRRSLQGYESARSRAVD